MDIGNSGICEMCCNSLVFKTDKQNSVSSFSSLFNREDPAPSLFTSLPLLPNWNHLKEPLNTLVTVIQQAQDFRGKCNILDLIALRSNQY